MTVCSDWAVVLPDRADAVTAAAAVCSGEVLRHASGRPWLVGRWRPGRLTVADFGPVHIALLGDTDLAPDQLAAAAARVTGPAGLNALTGRLIGSAHLFASGPGWTRAQGTASGLRRLFTAVVNGVPIAATRADVLAEATRSGVDDDLLALRLLYPSLPHPLGDTTPWAAVAAVSPDHYVRLDRSATLVRWWVPPEPEVSIEDGAPVLRRAIEQAVRVRVTRHDLVTCDLSGGLDSSPLAVLAAGHAPRLIAMTTGTDSIFDEEQAWADDAAAALARVERDTLPAADLPRAFDGITEPAPAVDEPFTGEPIKARLRAVAAHVTRHGGGIHLTGHGGDEVMVGSKTYLRWLARTNPVLALRHARGHSSLRRWPLRRLLAAMADSRDHGTWLRAEVAAIMEPPRMNEPRPGWTFPPFRLPSWVTARAADAVRDQVVAASTVGALAADPGQHEVIDRIRGGARLIRQDQAVMAEEGLITSVFSQSLGTVHSASGGIASPW